LVPFRYQGQYEDEETGLYYNRFRYYSPQMGMYISSDPIGLAGNNPTLYGYVQDVNTWMDIFGLLEALTELAKEISESANHFLAEVCRTVAVGQDATGGLFAASSNGLDPGQVAKCQELGVTPLNTSTVHVNGQNLHAEEVLLKNVENLKTVATWKRMPCGPGEHNCMQQLKDLGIKVECH
ncbi:RHS repeat-associated core domain-containing protein, partial [Phocaeicola coprophilus]